MIKGLRQYSIYITMIFVFGVFVYIGTKTPLAGDDWAFANNANSMGIFDSAMSMFFGWEGRLMTLFSIHFFIQYKMLWVVMNALIYTGIIYFFILSFKNKQRLLLITIALFVIFSIKDNIRMEVYSWITGSVYYGIPLFMSVLYFYNLLNTLSKDKPTKLNYFIGASTALYLPLGMENISISILIVSIYILFDQYFRKKRIEKGLIIYIIFMLIGFAIWSISPGSSIRLATMPEWTQLSLIEKVFRNLPSVLFFSFFENKEIIVLVGVFMSLFLIQRITKKIKYLSIFVYMLSMFVVVTPSIIVRIPSLTFLNEIANGYSLFNQIFWVIYALNLGINLYFIAYYYLHNSSIFYAFLVAFFASAALFMSPVIGYRLMVYPVFYLLFVILGLAEQVNYKNIVPVTFSVVFLLLTLLNVRTLLVKYQSVENITNERNLILEDYYQYSDQYTSGIWLPRYPIYTIHGGDIEFEDTYHMKAFKTYFDIPQDELITFYWKEQY